MPISSQFCDPERDVMIHRHFLSSRRCAEISLEMQRGRVGRAKVITADGNFEVREEIRQADRIDLSSSTLEYLRLRLRNLTPFLSWRFQSALTGVERPFAVTYGPGDFFVNHRDRFDDGPAAFQRRLLAAVVFLNEWTRQRVTTSGFSGGVIKLYPRANQTSFGRCLPICAETGMLAVFRADVLHEVSAVTRGHRHSVVAFFT